IHRGREYSDHGEALGYLLQRRRWYTAISRLGRNSLMVEAALKLWWTRFEMHQLRPAGVERCKHRRLTRPRSDDPDNCHIQPLSQTLKGLRSPLWGTIIAHALEQLRWKGVGNLVGRGSLLPHLVKLTQSRGVAHALKMGPIA